MLVSDKIKNIIFDFGGVLFDIDYDAPVRAFANLGFKQFEEIYSQAKQDPIFDKMEMGKVTNEEFMHYLHSFVPGATREQVADAWNCILLGIMPEQVEYARQLKNRGYRTFVLSNTNAIHVAEFERMIDERIGLANYRKVFEKIYYSNEIGIKKPDPETFLEVCRWNDLIPDETLFIDDSLKHVHGAEKAGLHVYHLKKSEKLNEAVQF